MTAVSISNQKYVQGISVLCATVLLYSQSQQEALSIIFHITQSQIYQNYLQLSYEKTAIYSQILYKTATSLLQNAAVLKILKINPNQLKYSF